MNNRGFTLIELSIVLVIIGLIIGGVLVGRDLISAAAIRAQISQIEKYDAAVYTFNIKYGGLPGDMSAADAAAFGMAARSGAIGDGNGDGILQYSGGSAGNTIGLFGGEDALFWNDLSFAGLIDGNFTSDVDSGITIPAGQASKYLPTAKIGNGNSIAVFDITGYAGDGPTPCGQGTFCYSIIASVYTDGSFIYNYQAGITPLQAYSIDTKMDDGVPNSGRVWGNIQASDFPNYISIMDAPTTPCLANPSGDGKTFTYNVGDSSNANKPVCMLNIAHK